MSKRKLPQVAIASPMVVAVINQKGGVGKTTTCFHLSGAFSKMGLRTLLIDFDPQANLTQGFFGSGATERLDPSGTIVRLFDEKQMEPRLDEVIRDTPLEGVQIVAGHESLEDYDETKPQERGVQQFVLRSFIKEVLASQELAIDVVLIDCRPTLNLLSWNALLAANRLVIPFQPEDFGSQGVVKIQRKFEEAVASHNPSLRKMGYLQTMVDGRVSIHKNYNMVLRQMYGGEVFEQVVPRAAALAESVTAKQVIHQYKPRVKAAKVIEALALEMVERHEALERQQSLRHHEDEQTHFKEAI